MKKSAIKKYGSGSKQTVIGFQNKKK